MVPDPWAAAVDPLGEALHSLRMSGAFYCRSEFSAPWGVAMPPMPGCLMLHVITAGQAWLMAGDEPARLLQAGDLALVPRGEGHRMGSARDAPAMPLFDLPRALAGERYELLRHGGGGEPCEMLCAAVRFDQPSAHRLVALMPPCIVISAGPSPQAEWLQATLRWVTHEARAVQPGGETVLTRLADVLVVQALRAWLANDPAAGVGWLGALRDRQLGRALAALHRDPARDWTLAELAAEAAMSRSAFAARFKARVGEAPLAYLTRWRMQLAAAALQEEGEDTTLAVLAERLGYESEAAFSRAFKRVMGTAPGALRRRTADAAPASTSAIA